MITPEIERIAEILAPQAPVRWKILPVSDDMSPRIKRTIVRLNGFGSLFYFNKVILNHSRLSPNLHGLICRQLEQESLRLALEVPRDMFKTTVASVSAPMWWALPFNDGDEELMRKLGYGDAWIRWMYRSHYSSTRTLIASEIIDNAIKIGTRISGHYQHNAEFRFYYPEIIPKTTEQLSGTGKKKDKWNAKSMTHNRVDSVYVGEGTYNFIGAKGALQSQHFERQVIDDPVGEKAIKSDIVMNDTCEWIRKLPGAFDSDPDNPGRLADQLFIGNRWSERDVGAFLRREYGGLMKFETHSAEGGCCSLHPGGESIFPEEFPMEKLAELRKIWGAYHYSAQYLNNPIAADAVRFKSHWLRWFTQVPWIEQQRVSVANAQQLGVQPSVTDVMLQLEQDRAEASGAVPQRLRMALQHEATQGEVLEDIRAGELERVAILDPSHSETPGGRSRHAIMVVGIYNKPNKPKRVYLLECWAGQTSFEVMIDKAIGTRPGNRGLAVKWRVGAFYLESKIAGQQGWYYVFRDRCRAMGAEASYAVRELKTDRAADAKNTRIIGMEPVYENGFFYVNRAGCQQFIEEYEVYPNGRFIDLLDVAGYIPQTFSPGGRSSSQDIVREDLMRRRRMMQSVGNAGY